MAKFNRGEICIGQNFVESQCYNGMECEVMKVCLLDDTGVNLPTNTKVDLRCPFYLVKFCDGADSFVNEHNLRRKPPQRKDRDIKTEWDETIWSPHEVTA